MVEINEWTVICDEEQWVKVLWVLKSFKFRQLFGEVSNSWWDLLYFPHYFAASSFSLREVNKLAEPFF